MIKTLFSLLVLGLMGPSTSHAQEIDMTQQTLVETQSSTYTNLGASKSNNAKANENFTELYGAVARFQIDASELMAPADTSVEVANTEKLTIPANTIANSDRLRITGFAKVTNQNGTNTLTPRLRIGGLTGVVLATVTAYDAATNDRIRFEADVFFETKGAASKVHSVGVAKRTGGSEEDTFVEDDSSLNTTAAIDIVFTQQWSANSASNRCKLYDLSAELHRVTA